MSKKSPIPKTGQHRFFAQPVAIRVEQVNKKIKPKRVFFIKGAKLPPWKQFNLHVFRMKDEKGKKCLKPRM